MQLQSLETQNEIAEYRLRLNRKQGEWIEQNIPAEGAREPGYNAAKNSRVTLSEAGIDGNDSPIFRTLAKIPEGRFERYIAQRQAAIARPSSVPIPGGLETQNEIAEYRLRLNRKQGEWIEQNIPVEGGKSPLPTEISQLSHPTLADAGIDRNDSPKFRMLARRYREYHQNPNH